MRRADEMRAAFARFEQSGLTLKAFGEREEISYTTLQYWRRRLRDGESAAKPRTEAPAPVDLAPVHVIQDNPQDARFDVWLSNGVSIEVPAGFDDAELRRLVGVLLSC